ncbi:unnamed protein product [Cuscuta campestris]|uniref:Uncharacterized protein n=1 Tax=Cuscuta campestris TaxID=132261 RepID=A0A484NBE7_9ASTE|nr:unnamed protein product [Cuscuta campestris]
MYFYVAKTFFYASTIYIKAHEKFLPISFLIFPPYLHILGMRIVCYTWHHLMRSLSFKTYNQFWTKEGYPHS